MVKQLIIVLVVLLVIVAGLSYWHVNRPNPYSSPVFFGE